MVDVITQHMDIWTSAQLTKSTAGRGNNGKQTAYGIKKLRELILELAVRGKLVPQDPNDEPASVLLEKIAKEKARLIKEGEIRKQAPSIEINEDEKPFNLPNGWEWVRLDNIGSTCIGLTYSPKDISEKGIPVLRSSNIQGGKITLSDLVRVDVKVKSSLIVEQGDLLICVRNGSKALVGKTAMITGSVEKMTFGAFMAIYRSQCNAYVEVFLNSPIFRNLLEGVSTTTINQITQANLKNSLIPLPPLAEQHRIVAKVDELMALCDQLEQQQTDSHAAHQTLVETLLRAMIAEDAAAANKADAMSGYPSQDEFAAAWQRIAEHFDTLFTTEHNIDQLKQTILQLAVMGKLVPQDPNDEPASVLLEKIAEEKARLVKEGKIKNQKPLLDISDDEVFFEIPREWKWTRLDNLALHSDAGWSPNCDAIPRDGENWGVLKVSAVTWAKYNPNENKALPATLEPKPEYEVMPGDFLISRANTAELVARAVVVPNDSPSHLMMSDKIIRFVFSKKVNSAFINLVNSSSFSRSYYAKVAGGTSSSMKNVSREQIRMLLIALPPLAEQHRIVAKVDELMAICDTLKARIKLAETTQINLADVIVEQAVA